MLRKNEDILSALLTYRPTPPQNGYSPIELLKGCRLQTQLPTHPANLYPSEQMKYCQLVEEKENSYRLNQQRSFDKRHRAKELLALLSNVKLKEEEHLLWLPVKPGTAYRYLCGK